MWEFTYRKPRCYRQCFANVARVLKKSTCQADRRMAKGSVGSGNARSKGDIRRERDKRPNGAFALQRNTVMNPDGAHPGVGVKRHSSHAHCINRHMFYSLGIKEFLIGSQGKPSLGAAFVGLIHYSSYAGM
jgi:hypothetical protein